MLLKLLTKLGYKTDEEVRKEATEKLKREAEKKRKSWEEKLRQMSDSERLDVIEFIVRYETDPERMRKKIIKVLESRPKPEIDREEWLWEEDWFWTPGAAGGYFDPFDYLPGK